MRQRGHNCFVLVNTGLDCINHQSCHPHKQVTDETSDMNMIRKGDNELYIMAFCVNIHHSCIILSITHCHLDICATIEVMLYNSNTYIGKSENGHFLTIG